MRRFPRLDVTLNSRLERTHAVARARTRIGTARLHSPCVRAAKQSRPVPFCECMLIVVPLFPFLARLWVANHDDADLLHRTASGVRLKGVQLNPRTLAAAFGGGKRAVSSCALDRVDVNFSLAQLYSRPVAITVRAVSVLGRAHPPRLTDAELADTRDQLRGNANASSSSKSSSSSAKASSAANAAASLRYSKKRQIKDAFTVDVQALRVVQASAAMRCLCRRGVVVTSLTTTLLKNNN